jgi:hypothetical protein
VESRKQKVEIEMSGVCWGTREGIPSGEPSGGKAATSRRSPQRGSALHYEMHEIVESGCGFDLEGADDEMVMLQECPESHRKG